MNKNIFGVMVELPFPEKWGDPFAIIDKNKAITLHEAIWSHMDYILNGNNPLSNWMSENLATITDETDGFDRLAVRLYIDDFKDEEHLNKTIKWCEDQMQQAYDMLSKHQKKLAKH